MVLSAMDPDEVLMPNQLITLEIGKDEDKTSYASRIEDVLGNVISVAAPVERGALIDFRPGTEVTVFLIHEKGRFLFNTKVIERRTGPLPTLLLAKPHRLAKGQRRRHLRVRVTLFPSRSSVIDPDPDKCRSIKIAIVDISGGGVRFVGNDFLPVGTRVHLVLDLPFGCGLVKAVATVLRHQERSDAMRSRYETAALFSEITESNRDRICKFALRQQVELAKRGLTRGSLT